MINREGVNNLLKSYWPDADNETLNKMADEVIINVIPLLYAEVRKTVSNEKSECFLEKYN